MPSQSNNILKTFTDNLEHLPDNLIRKLQKCIAKNIFSFHLQSLCQTPSGLWDILYDQAFNNSFHDRLESIQYNACLAITGAIRGTSREKLYQELGLEPLRLRRWYRKLCLFYKVFKNEHPQYHFHLIPSKHSSHTSRNVHSIPFLSVKHSFLLLSPNGINWILPSAILKAYLYLEKIFFISQGQLPILFTIVIILKELNLLRDFVLV